MEEGRRQNIKESRTAIVHQLRNNNDSGIAKWEKSDAKDYLKSALDDASHPYWYDPPSKVYDDGVIISTFISMKILETIYEV